MSSSAVTSGKSVAEKAIEQAIQKAVLQAKVEIAKRLLIDSASVSYVKKITDLPIEKIEKLDRQVKRLPLLEEE